MEEQLVLLEYQTTQRFGIAGLELLGLAGVSCSTSCDADRAYPSDRRCWPLSVISESSCWFFAGGIETETYRASILSPGHGWRSDRSLTFSLVDVGGGSGGCIATSSIGESRITRTPSALPALQSLMIFSYC